jgi:Tol biopolymer transport system component
MTNRYEQAVQFLGSNTRPLVDRNGVRPVWLDDGTFWYIISTPSGREYVLINPADGSRKTATSQKDLLGDSAKKPVVRRRRSSLGIPSPDKKKEAFIRDWNLWVKDLATQKETQLTTDGIENFGYATDNAGWRKSDRPILLWSPDSKKIATYQQDQRHVSDMHLVTTNVGAPTLKSWKYPLPQDKDIIRIHRVVIEVDQPKVIRLKLPADPRRGTLCDDISCSGAFDDNEWSTDSKYLAFVSSSRDHKIAQLRIADVSTGEVRDIFEEEVATQYESGQGTIYWRYLAASNDII